MQHAMMHHSAASELDNGNEGGKVPGCVGTTQENPDDVPQDEPEEANADHMWEAEDSNPTLS